MDGALRDIPKDGWEYEPIEPTAFGISKGGHVAHFSSFFWYFSSTRAKVQSSGTKTWISVKTNLGRTFTLSLLVVEI